jgi:hypothetical protein
LVLQYASTYAFRLRPGETADSGVKSSVSEEFGYVVAFHNGQAFEVTDIYARVSLPVKKGLNE